MLYEKLESYGKSSRYPFHMPGHKRSSLKSSFPYEMDITEIEGFDNLHHARGILKGVQQKAARLYGSKACFYLINGSTCGILAAISAAVGRNEKILVARNSHKSVYHALFLRQLKAEYLYPVETVFGIQGQITKEQVETALKHHPDSKAVLLTSPTYDGVVSDIESIAEVVHAYQIPLIVDSAHGAHFGFSKGFPENVVKLGADVVIESVHKTLPAPTQTALLHVCSERVPLNAIKKYLAMYQTSSPSYLLMAGIDACVDFLETEKESRFAGLEENLNLFYENVSDLKQLRVLRKCDFSKEEAFDFDISKLLIFYKYPKKTSQVSGASLQKWLLEEYGLQMEMACGNYVLALSSIMDTKEGFDRLAEALHQIDDRLRYEYTKNRTYQFLDEREKFCENELENLEHRIFQNTIYQVQKKHLEIFEAEERAQIECPFEEAVGKIAADYMYLYPPGIPILVPGEEITKNLIEDMKFCQSKGLEVEGISENGTIAVINGMEKIQPK